MQLRQAQKSKSKLRIGIAGPSGSGKTYSALLLAHGMAPWKKICVIDTENMSADLYSDLGAYNVITLEAPFSPARYVEAVESAEAAGMEVIIIDSITHEWSGTGGCLQIQEQLGGRFQDWAKVTPMHERFKDAILKSKAHVITTVRSKTDYVMTDDGGKSKVQKVGLKQETREGFEYELTLSFELNIRHLAEASKDRTGLYMDADPFTINEETGKNLLKWAESGVDLDKLGDEIEKMIIDKGYDPKKTLGHYKVDSFGELNLATLIHLKEAIEKKSPNKEKEEDLDKPEQDVDKSAHEKPEEKSSKSEETEEQPEESPKDEEKESEPEPSATSGQVKMLEIIMKKRAVQAKKGFQSLWDYYLEKLEVKKFTDASQTVVKELTEELETKNKEYVEAHKSDAPAEEKEAKEIFPEVEGSPV